MSSTSHTLRVRIARRVSVWIACCTFVGAGASAQLTPDRTFYGVNRPMPMTAALPDGAGADASVEIALLAPVSAEELERATASAGDVNLAELFPVLWSTRSPDVRYAQLFVDGEKVGPAVVLVPMQSPRQAMSRGNQIVFSPESQRLYTGIHAYTDRHVVFETSAGEIEFALRPDHAPNTAWNMIELAEGGFYTDIVIHRIVPAAGPGGEPFVVQFGDPTGTGGGGPGWHIDLESSELPHDFGVLSMARSGDPDSGGSQVFICLSRGAAIQGLDGRYTSFGSAVRGADAIIALERTPLENEAQGVPAEPKPVVKRAWTVPAPPYGEGPEPVERPAAPTGADR